MIDQKVVDYIKKNLEKGYPLSVIHQKLASSGVPDFVINESTIVAQQGAQMPQQMPQQVMPHQFLPVMAPQKKSRKVALIISMIVILFVLAGVTAYLYFF